MINHLRGSAGV